MEELLEKLKYYAERKGGSFSFKYNGWSGINVIVFVVSRDEFKVKFTGKDAIHNLNATIYKVQEKYNFI